MPCFFVRKSALGCCLAAASFLAGCGESAVDTVSDPEAPEVGHHHDDHHDHHDEKPAGIDRALEEVRELRAEVEMSLSEDSTGHASECVKVLLDIVKLLPEVAADSDMPERDWVRTKQLAENLAKQHQAVGVAIREGDYGKANSLLLSADTEIAKLDEIVSSGT